MVLIPADRRRRQRLVHQSSRRLEALCRNGGRAGRQVSDPFIVDRVCPTRVNKAIYSSLDEDVSEMERIEDAGVENRDRRLKHHNVA